MQIPQFRQNGFHGLLVSAVAIVIAAFSYPLGNRKMMGVCGDRFSAIQRVFGMTLCSIPFWLICGSTAMIHAGLPSIGQMVQSLCVAVFSGVVATVLFFKATDLVRENPKQLAVIEATQSGEVIFTLLLGVIVLHDSIPSPISFVGIALIVLGMILNSLVSV